MSKAKAGSMAGLWAGGLSFLCSWVSLWCTADGGRGRARQLLQGRPQEVGSRCWQEPQVHFVLVTNGWRRLDLNTSAGDRHPPQPLRYLALGE